MLVKGAIGHQTDNNPLSDPLMTQVTDVYMCHTASMNSIEIIV